MDFGRNKSRWQANVHLDLTWEFRGDQDLGTTGHEWKVRIFSGPCKKKSILFSWVPPRNMKPDSASSDKEKSRLAGGKEEGLNNEGENRASDLRDCQAIIKA